MASVMLSVRAFWASQLRTWCSQLSPSSHLLRLELLSVYRELDPPTHITLWSCRETQETGPQTGCSLHRQNQHGDGLNAGRLQRSGGGNGHQVGGVVVLTVGKLQLLTHRQLQDNRGRRVWQIFQMISLSPQIIQAQPLSSTFTEIWSISKKNRHIQKECVLTSRIESLSSGRTAGWSRSSSRSSCPAAGRSSVRRGG
ncbi:hypothetical protein F7725_006083 [Dissostichus mawsoni]|uniref:Uncharacterized protein n=1 Tax=Dissostichus mawsoni TaxID=36200 RepID=A0A7J5YX82_DISMA|nr:hypothetical protein F7725_006083 [Dissostichus mawsoni]